MNTKTSVDVLLRSADIKGAGFERLLRHSRNLLTVDLLWPRVGIAKKTAAREARFEKARVDFSSEPWAKRILFREEIEDHAALAVSVSEALDDEKLEQFFRLTAKAALKTGTGIVTLYTAGLADVASAPLTALSTMVGNYPGPSNIATGTLDLPASALPSSGHEVTVVVPLRTVRRLDPRLEKPCGNLSLVLRAFA